jgi:hypothetical protein
MAVRPAHAAAFERMPDLYSIAEDAGDAFAHRMAPSPVRPSTAGAAQTYPMYPGLQTLKTGRRPSVDSVTVLNRPRRLSRSSEYSVVPSGSQGPAGSRATRNPSWENGLGYEPADVSMRTSSYMQPQTPVFLKKQRSRARLGDAFASVPGEVLEVILDKLKQIHLEKGSESCATCWMRDACSVALCSRRWSTAARLAL